MSEETKPIDPVSVETVRDRERAIWTDVERVGRDLRAADAANQPMTQAGVDREKLTPRQ